MPNYAVMSGNTVENVIVTDDKEQSEKDLHAILIEVTPENPAGGGWTYDPETGRFSPPPAVDEEVITP